MKFLPPPKIQSNHESTVEHCEFVDEAVSNLITNCCAIKVDEKPYLCSPLLVVKNPAGKLLNLKYLNQFLEIESFKYEDLRIAALMFEKMN